MIQKQKITISKDPKKKPKRLEIVQGQSSSAAHSQHPDEEDSNGYMNANVDNSDGGRKEIPQINEIGNQARSKYFPSHSIVSQSGASNQGGIPRVKLQQD